MARKSTHSLARKREELAWELASKGLTEARIAEAIAAAGLGSISQQGVSAALIRVEARVLAELSERAGAMKASQTARLERIYREAMAAWDAERTPKLLDVARGALADLRKVWGLDAPARTDLTTGGQPVDPVVRFYIPDNGRDPLPAGCMVKPGTLKTPDPSRDPLPDGASPMEGEGWRVEGEDPDV